MVQIRESIEAERGCGYRKPGGTYLVSGGEMAACGWLPFAVDRCPTCDCGIKPARGWTWIDIAPWLRSHGCQYEGSQQCGGCPLSACPESWRAGLLWIGGKFYPTPDDFSKEAAAQGISRRITAVPKDFELGKTWVFLGHRTAVEKECPCESPVVSPGPYRFKESESCRIPDYMCPTCKGSGRVKAPGIFSAFKPERIEYVVQGDDDEEKLERLAARGISLVRVHRDIDVEAKV